jgi:hypothetical protein
MDGERLGAIMSRPDPTTAITVYPRRIPNNRKPYPADFTKEMLLVRGTFNASSAIALLRSRGRIESQLRVGGSIFSNRKNESEENLISTLQPGMARWDVARTHCLVAPPQQGLEDRPCQQLSLNRPIQ